jgi:hypothetical protein
MFLIQILFFLQYCLEFVSTTTSIWIQEGIPTITTSGSPLVCLPQSSSIWPERNRQTLPEHGSCWARVANVWTSGDKTLIAWSHESGVRIHHAFLRSLDMYETCMLSSIATTTRLLSDRSKISLASLKSWILAKVILAASFS